MPGVRFLEDLGYDERIRADIPADLDLDLDLDLGSGPDRAGAAAAITDLLARLTSW